MMGECEPWILCHPLYKTSYQQIYMGCKNINDHKPAYKRLNKGKYKIYKVNRKKVNLKMLQTLNKIPSCYIGEVSRA